MNDLKQESFDINSIPEPENIEDVIYAMMVNPNLSNMNYFNDFSDTSISPDSLRDEDKEESSIIEFENSGFKIIMGTHALQEYLMEYPENATEILIAKASRRLICLGATPIAVSVLIYNLDYGDPESQRVTTDVKKGLENAASCFNLKILEKKVRFEYSNDTEKVPVTLIVSMIGKIESDRVLTTHTLKKKGTNIFCIGNTSDDLNSSEYLEFYHNIANSGLPEFDIRNEVRIQNAIKLLNEKRLLSAATPVGKGGLFFTLFRSAIPNELGFDITTTAEGRVDSFLFGEGMGRILVDVDEDKENEFVDLLTEMDIPFFTLGHVTKGEIRIDDNSLGYIDKIIPSA